MSGFQDYLSFAEYFRISNDGFTKFGKSSTVALDVLDFEDSDFFFELID
jgi:hypothetical protein